MKDKDMDFAFVNDDGTPFRINAFFKLGKIGVVMRRIAAEPIPMEKL
jgi:Tfp pilus assembly ATPase PilU